MNIISEIPLWWLPIVAMVTLVISIGYYKKKDWIEEISPFLRKVLIGLRFLSLFLIVILLLGILLESISYKEEKPIFLTLLDDSSSMLNYEDSTAVKSTISAFQKELKEKFGDQFEYETVGLDLASVNVDSLVFNAVSTDIDHALKGLYDQYYNRNLGGIVLISDGNYNRGANPIYSGEKFKFVPIYSL
jgi:hypothetical protein